MAIELRDYQGSFVGGIADSFRVGHKRVCGVLPTGGGKTVCFSYLAWKAHLKKTPTLLLSHRIELMRQASAALLRFNVPHGRINPQYTPNPFELIQVGTVGTVISRLNRITPPKFIIVDECHHVVPNNTWGRILSAFPEARILGVTATPIRADGKGMAEMFEDMVKGPGTADLIAMGFLVQPLIYIPPPKFDRGELKPKRSGDYTDRELEEVIDKPNITGDAVQEYMRICPGTPAIYSCVSIQHAEHVAEAFRAAGFRAEPVDGTMEDAERARILAGLGDGSVQVVTFCSIISEGTDIPAIGCVGMLRPTESESLYLQIVGRGLRPCAGKDRAVIIDHVGNVVRHGRPEIERHWELQPSEMKNKRDRAGYEDTMKVLICGACFATFEPAPACPQCGHEAPKPKPSLGPTSTDGELIELGDGLLEDIRRKQRVEVAMARSLNELIQIQHSRNYKNGWAHTVWSIKQKKFRAEADKAALRAKTREELEAIAERYGLDAGWVTATWSQRILTNV